MKLNTFLLFDAALMFLCLPILIILKGKKNNENTTIYRYRAKNGTLA